MSRKYHKITQKDIAEFTINRIVSGNSTSAVLKTTDEYKAPHDRGYRLLKKSEDSIKYVDDKMIELSVSAINRVGEMIESKDESIATRNSHYILDHVKGKATQKNININTNMTIDDIF